MTRGFIKYGAFLIALVALAILTTRVLLREHAKPEVAVQAAPPATAKASMVEASALRIHGVSWNGKASDLLNPAHNLWKSAKSLSILLNLTPRIYVTDKIASEIPEAFVRYARTSDGVVLHLAWRDGTRDQPNVMKPSPAGTGAGVRVVHSEATDRFYDAAAVMVPANWNPAANPSIQMGEKDAPVDIYFWHAVRGPAVMKASGRGTTERTKNVFPAKALHAGGEWHVTFVLPTLPNGTPVAFAIWDGSKGQRSGLKYYSVWHSLR